MSEQAEAQQTEQSSAAEDTPTIPKYRFDQVAAELRALREGMQIKDQAIETLQRQIAPQARPDPEEEEALQSLDPTQLRAVNKLIDKKLNVGRDEMRNYLGVVGNKLDEQEFLIKNGKDKSKYLDRIRSMRRDHAARGLNLDSEMAYKFILVEEMESRLDGKRADPAPAAKEKKDENPAPPAQGTRTQSAAKQTKTIEEMEADLDEQIKASPSGKV